MIPTELTELTFEFDDEVIPWFVKRTNSQDAPIYVYCDHERFTSRFKSNSRSLSHLRFLYEEFLTNDPDYDFFRAMVESYPGNPE